jgi:cytochrome P450
MPVASASNLHGPARASLADTVGFLKNVVIPTVGKGLFIRREPAVTLASRRAWDRRAVQCMQSLHDKYGDGPLLLAIPGRTQAVILSGQHVHDVLLAAPEPFSPASLEKRLALAHFEPRASLVSSGEDRARRRSLNDAALESTQAVHTLASHFAALIVREMDALVARSGPLLGWQTFLPAWYRMIRRILLGPRAAEDDALTDMLAKLRSAGNWAFLHPGRHRLRERFHARLLAYLQQAEAGTLVGCLARQLPTKELAPVDQVTHWLFGFESAGIATYRALGLIANDALMQQRAYEEAISADPVATPGAFPLLRACMLESLRLWPTTPLLLRETTRSVRWPDGGSLREHTNVVIYVPFFHRDPTQLPFADRFAPELWLREDQREHPPLVPFSEGPGICPAHHLVPLIGSLVLAAILRRVALGLQERAGLRPESPLPGTLDHFKLCFALLPRSPATGTAVAGDQLVCGPL